MENANLSDFFVNWGGTVSDYIEKNAPVPEGFPEIGTAPTDMTWEEIQKIVQAGLAKRYFKLGDLFGPINIYSKVIDQDYNPNVLPDYSGTYYTNVPAYYALVAFDHNLSMESDVNHTITLMLMYQRPDLLSYPISTEQKYGGGSVTGRGRYAMLSSGNEAALYTTASNLDTIEYGDEQTYFPYCGLYHKILPIFLNNFPTSLQSAIAITKKHHITKSGESVFLKQKLFIPSSYELGGDRFVADSVTKEIEEQYEKPFEYLTTLTNPLSRYRYDDSSNFAEYWTRTPVIGTNTMYTVNNSRYASFSAYETYAVKLFGYVLAFNIG